MRRFVKEKVLLPTVLVSLVLCFFVFIIARNTVVNVSAVVANGVGVYWDSGCSNVVSSISWGTLQPGAANNVTVYIRNEAGEPVCLILSATNWNPTQASQYLDLGWNCSVTPVNPGEVLQTVLTLSVSRYIEGISSFSFNIVITGSACIHDVAVTSVSVSPTTLLPGTIVHINATAQDQGDFAETFNVTAYANSHHIGVQKVSLSIGSLKTILFTWNTTGYSTGDYIVSAVASTVPGETDTTNNVKAAANIVTILYNGHYIAVVSVKSIKTVVGQGYCDNLEVTAKNFGVYTERFNVTAHANTTAIETQTPNLTSGNNATLTFTWNTEGFSYGNYTISAYATPVPGQTDTSNNTLIDGWVLVSIPGDVIGDRYVGGLDITVIGSCLFTSPGEKGWNPNCDIMNTGFIGGIDITIVGQHLFQSW